MLSQKKTNSNPLAHPAWKCLHTNLWIAKLFHLTEGLLRSFKRWRLRKEPVVGCRRWLRKEPVVICGKRKGCGGNNLRNKVLSLEWKSEWVMDGIPDNSKYDLADNDLLDVMTSRRISHVVHLAAAQAGVRHSLYDPLAYTSLPTSSTCSSLPTFSQSCPWVHFVWPVRTEPISWLAQPNPTQPTTYGKNWDPTQYN